MQGIHYFAGANTARGFTSCFDSILPRAQQKRMFYIKGGPGVGKSTLMKRFAHLAQEKGMEVEVFHCSSDPDSLDGVSIPSLGIGLMDGTAPHVYDPAVPGARDTLISLGDFLDEKALAPHAGEIAEIQRQISARFAGCYRYLAAAEQVLSAAPAAEENAAKVRETAEEWAKRLPLRGGTGTVRRLFASAHTPKGLVDVTDLSCFERRVTVDVPFGAHGTGLLGRIADKAVERGLDVVLLLDPLIPERIAHAVIPAHGLAFCTGRKTARSSGEWLEADALFDASKVPERDQGFDRNACGLLFERAHEQLAQAKKLHDELERFYIRGMDFEGWQRTFDRMIQTLG